MVKNDSTYTVYHDGVTSPTPVVKDQRYSGGAWGDTTLVTNYSYAGTEDFNLAVGPNNVAMAVWRQKRTLA